MLSGVSYSEDLEYVRGEWSLAAAAFNLKKLTRRCVSCDTVAVGGAM